MNDIAVSSPTRMDPIRAYLKQIGAVALLSRDAEVMLAKRIEDGERRITRVLLTSPPAIDELLRIAQNLGGEQLRAHDLVADLDPDDAELDRASCARELLDQLGQVRRDRDRTQVLAAELRQRGLPAQRRKRL